MYNDLTITIEINGLRNKLLIIRGGKGIISNDRIVNISDDDLDNFFRIISNWNSEYISNNGIDNEETIINIDKKRCIIRGDYPYNYNEFIEWMDDIYAR